MVDGEPAETGNLLPRRPGERLRDARASHGLSLEDVAARTRIPLRHLAAIETGDYSGLPSETYAMGFSKAYARAVGLDEVGIAREVRGEIAGSWDRPAPHIPYEISDPARTPSRGVVMAGVVVAVLLAITAAIWFGTDLFRGGADAPTAPVETPTASVAVPPPGTTVSEAQPSATGQVALTATDTVWVRVYDASGTTLFQDEMTPGERYEVPTTANEPRITVARAERLAVTINGSAVAPLGDGRTTLRGEPVSAAALIARNVPAPAAAPAPATPGAVPPPAFAPATANPGDAN